MKYLIDAKIIELSNFLSYYISIRWWSKILLTSGRGCITITIHDLCKVRLPNKIKLLKIDMAMAMAGGCARETTWGLDTRIKFLFWQFKSKRGYFNKWIISKINPFWVVFFFQESDSLGLGFLPQLFEQILQTVISPIRIK